MGVDAIKKKKKRERQLFCPHGLRTNEQGTCDIYTGEPLEISKRELHDYFMEGNYDNVETLHIMVKAFATVLVENHEEMNVPAQITEPLLIFINSTKINLENLRRFAGIIQNIYMKP